MNIAQVLNSNGFGMRIENDDLCVSIERKYGAIKVYIHNGELHTFSVDVERAREVFRHYTKYLEGCEVESYAA